MVGAGPGLLRVHAKSAKDAKMNDNELSYKIIGAALAMHKLLGPGLLESAYEAALARDLTEIGLDVKRQITMPFVYKDIDIEVGYRIDILVNDVVIIELKAVEELAPVHFAQTFRIVNKL